MHILIQEVSTLCIDANQYLINTHSILNKNLNIYPSYPGTIDKDHPIT
jgi:hypothetical protein